MTDLPRPNARRLAVALLRLEELGDSSAARSLVDGLDADDLRQVLLAQTTHVGLLFEASFGQVFEQRLPAIAAAYGRSRAEVTADYLELLTLSIALREGQGA